MSFDCTASARRSVRKSRGTAKFVLLDHALVGLVVVLNAILENSAFWRLKRRLISARRRKRESRVGEPLDDCAANAFPCFRDKNSACFCLWLIFALNFTERYSEPPEV